MGDIFVYVQSLLQHWTGYVTGSVMTMLFFFIEKFFKHEPPLWVYVVVFIVSGVSIGSFGTWEDERVSAAIDHTDSAKASLICAAN